MRLHILISSMFALLALSACGPKELTLSSFNGSKMVTVLVDVADTPAERDVGLMNVTTLDLGKGMLFVFPEPAMLSFWMKNTKIPLEVMFFDALGEFVSTAQMIPCEGEPCPKYTAQSLSQYALEVNPDFREANGIGVGWRIDMKQVKKIARPK